MAKFDFFPRTFFSSIISDDSVHGSMLRLVALLSLTIFTAEAVIMTILGYAGPDNKLIEGLIDSVLLTAAVFPVLYFFIVKNLENKNQALTDARERVRNTCDRLEQRVVERTRKLNRVVVRARSREHEMSVLGEVSHLFQTCRTFDEARDVAAKELPRLFSGASGALMMVNSDGSSLEKIAEWGDFRGFKEGCNMSKCPATFSKDQQRSKAKYGVSDCSQLMPSESAWNICLPMKSFGQAVGTLFLEAPRGMADGGKMDDQLVRGRTTFYQTVAESLSVSIANLRLREELEQQALRDPLTGLYNRRYLVDYLERELMRTAREALPLSIIMLDIDHFKRCNDTYGHDAGDTVLKELAAVLDEWTRGEDVVSRHGGEEFVVVLPGTDPETAMRRADVLREAVAALNLSHQGQELGQITISAGVATCPDLVKDKAALIRAADQAMYRSKQNGRNRVTLAADQTGGTSPSSDEQLLKLSA